MAKYLSTWFTERLISEGNTQDRLLTQSLNYRDDIISQGFTGYIDYHQSSIAEATKTYAQMTVPSDKYVVLIDREITTDKERSFFRSYTTYDTVTESTVIPVKNLRLSAPYAAETTVKVCTTPATIDQSSIVTNIPIFGTLGNGNRASGGINANALFRLFPPSAKILFEWENASASAIYMATMMAWFELPESAIIT